MTAGDAARRHGHGRGRFTPAGHPSPAESAPPRPPAGSNMPLGTSATTSSTTKRQQSPGARPVDRRLSSFDLAGLTTRADSPRLGTPAPSNRHRAGEAHGTSWRGGTGRVLHEHEHHHEHHHLHDASAEDYVSAMAAEGLTAPEAAVVRVGVGVRGRRFAAEFPRCPRPATVAGTLGQRVGTPWGTVRPVPEEARCSA